MLQLTNIKALSYPEVWARGENYFINGLVTEIGNSGNQWNAVVKGSFNYQVRLQVEGGDMADWECNCPYDHGSVCKHVVAVALAVEEMLVMGETEEVSSTLMENGPKPVYQIKIDKVPAKVLKQFCKEYACQNPEFISDLTEFLSPQSFAGEKKINYVGKIRKAIDRATDRDGFINYYAAPAAFDVIFNLLDKAEILIESNNFEEVFEISKAIFEEVAEVSQYMDDSDGMVIDSMERSQEFIGIILNSDVATIKHKNEIFDWLLGEYPKSKYYCLGDDMLLDMLIDVAKILDTVPHVLPILDQALLQANSEYKIENLQFRKLGLIKHSGQDEEAKKLIGQQLHLPRIRKMMLEELLQKKMYDEAKILIKEGIDIAREKHHMGTETDWHNELLQVYKKTNDKRKQLEVTRWLFKNDFGSRIEHLNNLKLFFEHENWQKERENLEKWLKKEKDGYLFSFYAHEEMYTELFGLLKKNPYFHNLQEYGKLLMDDYSEEILQMYAVEFNKMAERANTRKAYQKLVYHLKSVKKLIGGAQLVKKLVSGFRETYQKRPAMIEELSKMH